MGGAEPGSPRAEKGLPTGLSPGSGPAVAACARGLPPSARSLPGPGLARRREVAAAAAAGFHSRAFVGPSPCVSAAVLPGNSISNALHSTL